MWNDGATFVHAIGKRFIYIGFMYGQLVQCHLTALGLKGQVGKNVCFPPALVIYSMSAYYSTGLLYSRVKGHKRTFLELPDKPNMASAHV